MDQESEVTRTMIATKTGERRFTNSCGCVYHVCSSWDGLIHHPCTVHSGAAYEAIAALAEGDFREPLAQDTALDVLGRGAKATVDTTDGEPE